MPLVDTNRIIRSTGPPGRDGGWRRDPYLGGARVDDFGLIGRQNIFLLRELGESAFRPAAMGGKNRAKGVFSPTT